MRIKQHDTTDCGAACLASVAAYHKLKLPIAIIRQYASTGTRGTTLLGLIEAGNRMGFEAKGVKGTSVSLKKIPLPAIAHLVVNKNVQHYVVIYKVGPKLITIMDPSDGKMHCQKHGDFAREWTGVLLLLSPDKHFKTGNHKTGNAKRFLELMRPHKIVVGQALIGSLIYTVLGAATAIFVEKIADYVLVDGNQDLLNLMGLIMIVVLLLQFFIGSIKNTLIMRIGQQIDVNLILAYHKHLLHLPQRFFDAMRTGDLISRVNDAIKIRTFINDVAIGLALNILIVSFSFFIMFVYHWKLAILLLLIIPLYALIYSFGSTIHRKVQRRITEESAGLDSQMFESLNTIATIKRLGLEELAYVKIETQLIKLLRLSYKSGRTTLFSNSVVQSISQLFTIISLWVGAGYVLDNDLSPGQFFSYYALIAYFTGPAISLVSANKLIQDAIVASDRLFEVMDLNTEGGLENMELTPNLIGDIHFENVAFTYGNCGDVFSKLNLIIKAGSSTAIVGESGSGKSTIMSLIQKIYPIQQGNILIGKYSLNYFSERSLRSLIAVVPQKIDLFAGNVLDNIAMGDEEPNMQRVVDVCIQLDMIKFIEALPSGFQTYLGENGATVSGGQKQRIAIARALYRNPEILILDEATSSLDCVSERHVQSVIDLLVNQGKTVIIVTHRLTTARSANHIVVLDKGEVIEEGSHQDMMLAKKHYFMLWQKQFEGISCKSSGKTERAG